MSNHSSDEKLDIQIELLQFIENNPLSLNLQEKWEELGKKLNRDWKTIYEVYKELWAVESEELEPKVETEEQMIEASNSTVQETANAENNAAIELPATNSGNNERDEEIIQYVTLDGQTVNLDDYDQFILCDTNTLSAINNEVDEVAKGKRKLDLNDFDKALLNTLEEHGREELEMLREEHNRKMKLLKMQLEQGEEIHNEKMKILKTKLQALQQKVHHIDHVICNKHLIRKFKSGPI